MKEDQGLALTQSAYIILSRVKETAAKYVPGNYDTCCTLLFPNCFPSAREFEMLLHLGI